MSGIAGIYHHDGGPAEAAAIERMLRVAPARGRDGFGVWTSGPVALGHLMLHTTPESVTEPQPFFDAASGLCVVMDGRIDNRDELLGGDLLGDGPACGDAELLLRAYRRWGQDCPDRILGDFAFAIWDPANRRIFCARDALGIKPLYYYADDHVFLFASELRQILQHSAVDAQPNEGMVAEYLACAINDQEETLYRRVYRLAAGCRLSLEPAKISKSRYFEINPAKTIRYRRDEEYSEHFLDIFRESVRCRMRSHGRVGVFLSGGLDSSSVAAVASQSVAQGKVPDCGFESFSMTFPGEACDESAYIDQLAAHCSLRSNRSVPAGRKTAHYLDHVRRFRDFPDYPNGAMSNRLSEMARQKGFRVILTGLGGDEWLMGSFYHYADLLKRGEMKTLWRTVRSNAQLAGERFSPRTLMRFGLWPLLPAGMRRALDGALDRNRIPEWIDAQFAARTSLADRLRKDPPVPDFPSLAQKDIYMVLASGWRIHALEMEERSASGFGLEQRHPFSDRRVLEFALALPEEQRWRGCHTKYVLRNAMRSILPESIRERRSKAEFSPVFLNTFHLNGGAYLFHALPIAAQGWVYQNRIERKYREMEGEHRAGNHRYTRHTCPLWMIFGINLWYEALFGANESLTAATGA